MRSLPRAPSAAHHSSLTTHHSPLTTYAQLVRLPNVFTALADIAVGALAQPAGPAWWPAAWLFLASACLYSAGMVWNDYFDIEQDRRERPFRPLPSGRVSPRAAARFGTLLMASGLLAALCAGWSPTGLRSPALLAMLLAVFSLLYDRWLKRTWAGPLGMGACRCLNVLMGFSAVGGMPVSGLLPALVVGIYIVGVTWFARTEARPSSRTSLRGAALVILAALLLALALPAPLPPDTASPLFPYLLVGLGFGLGVPLCHAVAQPTPRHVQAAVKRAILGLIVLDAVLATALAGTAGLVILVLLPPAVFLGRWIYST